MVSESGGSSEALRHQKRHLKRYGALITETALRQQQARAGGSEIESSMGETLSHQNIDN